MEHDFYKPDALPVTQPTVSKHWMANTHYGIWGVNQSPSRTVSQQSHRHKLTASRSSMCQSLCGWLLHKCF